jgi:hypothetical protein
MDQIEDFSDERQKAWCIHCGGWISNLKTNRDHVPTKALLRKPYPANFPVVQVCVACNSKFSSDEEYLAAFLGAVVSGSTEPGVLCNSSAARILRRKKWLRTEIESSKVVDTTLWGETRILWTPNYSRINPIIVKNARGHVFFEYGEPMLDDPAYVSSRPLASFTPSEQADFEAAGSVYLLPEVGSRMLTRLFTGQDLVGPWVVVQDQVYRYAVAQEGGIRVRTVLSEYLATEVCWDA